jgi:hypothetical protein
MIGMQLIQSGIVIPHKVAQMLPVSPKTNHGSVRSIWEVMYGNGQALFTGNILIAKLMDAKVVKILLVTAFCEAEHGLQQVRLVYALHIATGMNLLMGMSEVFGVSAILMLANDFCYGRVNQIRLLNFPSILGFTHVKVNQIFNPIFIPSLAIFIHAFE